MVQNKATLDPESSRRRCKSILEINACDSDRRQQSRPTLSSRQDAPRARFTELAVMHGGERKGVCTYVVPTNEGPESKAARLKSPPNQHFFLVKAKGPSRRTCAHWIHPPAVFGYPIKIQNLHFRLKNRSCNGRQRGT